MNAADVKTVRKLGMLRSTGKNGRKRNVSKPFDSSNRKPIFDSEQKKEHGIEWAGNLKLTNLNNKK